MSGRSTSPIYMPEPINVCKPIKEMDNSLKPVAPCETGEGLPYAPMDWPNPGDNWGWRVGRRFSNLGYYSDRFIYLPKHLQKAGGPKQFASKLSLERYLKSEFPGADIKAFFASFSWKVPSSVMFATDVKAATFSPGASPQPEMEKVEEGTENTVKRKTKHTAASSSVKRQTRQSRRQYINEADDTNDSHSPNKEEADDLFDGKNSPDEHIPTEFDSYLDSLIDSLAQPQFEAPLPNTVSANSPSLENDLAGAQMLEENKAKVTSLRKEYSDLKEKVTLLQIEVDSNLLAVQGIDEQIGQLQSRRAELMSTIDAKKMAKFRLTINQKNVADAIQRIAHEIQLKTQKNRTWG